MNEKVRILIIDDREENRKAASEFFASQDIEVEFATTFEEGKEKLDNHIECYHAAIIDLELPVNGILMEIGFSLARLAENYGLPCVVLTAGPYHYGDTSKVYDEDATEMLRFIRAGKNTAEAWKRAYEILLKLCPLENVQEIFVSRKRYKENTGKQYQKRPEPKKGISPKKQ